MLRLMKGRRPVHGAAALIAGLLTAAAAVSVPASGAEHPMTLAEAIHLALDKNEDIAIGRESLIAAQAGVSGAQGAYDPFLAASGGWQRSSQPVNSAFAGAPAGRTAPTNKAVTGSLSISQRLPTGGALTVGGEAARETTDGTATLLTPAYDTRVGVGLRQPLLRGLAVDSARFSVRVARAERGGAAAALRTTVSEIVTAVERAYWNLVAARLQVGVLEEAVRLANEQLTETGSRVQNGTVAQTELAQPRAELERRTGDMLAGRENLSRAENALKVLILTDEDTLWPERLVPVDSVAVAPTRVDTVAALKQAYTDRPELAEREADLARRRAETAFARNGVWPALDAVLSYDRFGLTGTRNPALQEGSVPPGMAGNLGDSFRKLGDGDFNAARVALELGFPIRNRTARALAAQARSQERQAQADLARTRKTIRAEVLDAAAALQTAGQRIEAARAGREAAEVQLSAERDRYAVGLSTNFLVLTRQNDLSAARLQEIAALTDYRNAQAEMSRATGAVIANNGIDLPDDGR